MIASLIGILAGFILIMLGLILGVHSDHKVIGVLIMFAGIVSMFNFLPHYKEYKDEWGHGKFKTNRRTRTR